MLAGDGAESRNDIFPNGKGAAKKERKEGHVQSLRQLQVSAERNEAWFAKGMWCLKNAASAKSISSTQRNVVVFDNKCSLHNTMHTACPVMIRVSKNTSCCRPTGLPSTRDKRKKSTLPPRLNNLNYSLSIIASLLGRRPNRLGFPHLRSYHVPSRLLLVIMSAAYATLAP